MAKKIGFGALWFIVIYFLACAIVGGVAGGIAGANNPTNPDLAALAGAEVVLKFRIYIFLGSLAAAVFGAVKGLLPGTKTKASPLSVPKY